MNILHYKFRNQGPANKIINLRGDHARPLPRHRGATPARLRNGVPNHPVGLKAKRRLRDRIEAIGHHAWVLQRQLQALPLRPQLDTLSIGLRQPSLRRIHRHRSIAIEPDCAAGLRRPRVSGRDSHLGQHLVLIHPPHPATEPPGVLGL